MVTIRPVRLPEDRAQLLALDRSFGSDRVYRVVGTSGAFVIEDVAVQPSIHKEFPLESDLGEGRAWEHAVVAEHGGTIVGFAAWTHRSWNRRTDLWHLYVDAAQRGRGVGGMLITAVFAAAKAAGTRCVWLETSTLAYPAIQFYRRMGFDLCGLDLSLYDPSSVQPGEVALYFALPVTPMDGSEGDGRPDSVGSP